MNEEKLVTKDLVNIGVFSAIYFVLSLILMAPAMFSPWIWLLWPAIAGLICSFIYVLLATKVPKKNVCLIVGVITGVIYFLSGECTWTIVATFLVAGVIGEAVRKSAGFKSSNGIALSSGILSIGFIGSPLPMWLFKETYMSDIIQKGMDPVYVEKMAGLISPVTLIVFIVLAFIGGAVGALLGKKLFKNKFEKAGII